MDLLILAAGMGSRFGGLKQIEPIDEFGNFIIDYSIYDAKKAGFDKVVFLIKEENYEIFKETIGKRVENVIKTEYVFQKLDFIPKGYSLPSTRVKPLGTAQAILSCKDNLQGPFAMINADDFYGYDAFKVAADYLRTLENSHNKYANIAYNVENTLTENGSVKRGVLDFDNNHKLIKLVESKVEKIDGKIFVNPLDTDLQYEVSKDTLVSMNLFAFTHDIMDYLEEKFPAFLDENKNNLDKCEYLIPSVVSELIAEGKVTVDVLKTNSVWYGVTYREDKEEVVASLKKLVDAGYYPKGIWQNR